MNIYLKIYIYYMSSKYLILCESATFLLTCCHVVHSQYLKGWLFFFPAEQRS